MMTRRQWWQIGYAVSFTLFLVALVGVVVYRVGPGLFSPPGGVFGEVVSAASLWVLAISLAAACVCRFAYWMLRH